MNTPYMTAWALRIFVTTILLLIAAHHDAGAQTTITTKEGKEYRGSVVEERGDAVTLLTTDSVQVMVPRAQIRSVVYAEAAGSDASTPTTSVTEAAPVVEKTTFPVLGGTLGTPGGLNAVAGYYFDGWGVRLSGMYLSTINGIEFEFLKNIGRSGNFSHNIHIGIGSSHMELPDPYYVGQYDIYNWRYVKAGYDFNWNSFFVSAALSAGSGDFSNPQLMLQLGYVKEFR